MAKYDRRATLDGGKWCEQCSNFKPLEEFYRRTASKDGRSYLCKICTSKNEAERINAKPKEERRRIYMERDLKRNFGLTIEMYNALLLAQDGVCAICKESNPTEYRLAVDHNHENGQVRGLLCGPCNMLLHKIDNDMDWVNKAYSYLSKSYVFNLLREGEMSSLSQ